MPSLRFFTPMRKRWYSGCIKGFRRMAIEFAMDKRRTELTALLLEGLSYREIGERMGVSRQTVCEDVKAILAEWRATRLENTDDFAMVQLARLEKMHEGIWEEAKGGNLNAIDRVLAISRREAEIMGSDAAMRPKKTTEGPDGLTPTQRIDRIESILSAAVERSQQKALPEQRDPEVLETEYVVAEFAE